MENVIFFALSRPAIFFLLFPPRETERAREEDWMCARLDHVVKKLGKKIGTRWDVGERKTDEREHEKCVSNLQIISQVGLLSMSVHLSDQSTHSEIAICTQRSQITWDGWSWNSASFISIAHIFFFHYVRSSVVCSLGWLGDGPHTISFLFCKQPEGKAVKL